ncbi:hypothetical protein AURDEDRAFT_128677 [Auricularia subglabra TFB-10046 SS5]|nr:hypothetical protein AURDEDRAFT_128677 [Auricularia subglabra TFB-10046 SS5]
MDRVLRKFVFYIDRRVYCSADELGERRNLKKLILSLGGTLTDEAAEATHAITNPMHMIVEETWDDFPGIILSYHYISECIDRTNRARAVIGNGVVEPAPGPLASTAIPGPAQIEDEDIPARDSAQRIDLEYRAPVPRNVPRTGRHASGSKLRRVQTRDATWSSDDGGQHKTLSRIGNKRRIDAREQSDEEGASPLADVPRKKDLHRISSNLRLNLLDQLSRPYAHSPSLRIALVGAKSVSVNGERAYTAAPRQIPGNLTPELQLVATRYMQPPALTRGPQRRWYSRPSNRGGAGRHTSLTSEVERVAEDGDAELPPLPCCEPTKPHPFAATAYMDWACQMVPWYASRSPGCSPSKFLDGMSRFMAKLVPGLSATTFHHNLRQYDELEERVTEAIRLARPVAGSRILAGSELIKVAKAAQLRNYDRTSQILEELDTRPLMAAHESTVSALAK